MISLQSLIAMITLPASQKQSNRLMMASITIRNIDDEVKSKLRVRAAMNNRSMEEEVRVILKEATSQSHEKQRSLVDIAREAGELYGSFEVELPKRDDIRVDELTR
jgi:plasmid stability protein